MSLEIIELENDGIFNGRCNMKYTLIYKATNVTKFVHNWNIITFDRSLFESVSNTVCATGQCEQRPLEVGECVIYSNKEKNVIYPGTVTAKNANGTYTIDVTLLDQRLHATNNNNNNSDSLFQEDLGKNLIGEQLYELTLTKIPTVERVRLKTVNHIIKFIESGNKTTLYYTNFLNMAELTRGRLVSNTMFINLGTQTYLPFWCEPTKGFIAAPTIMTQLPEISGKTFIHAWTHYMNWCQNLHTFIETAEEAHAAYMYTFLKLELYGLGDRVAEFCNDHREHINVEQDKLLRILGKQGIVPNPPAIYMKKIVYDQLRIDQTESDKYFYGKLYQIHSKDETQRMLAAAKRVTEKIINAQKFPFVSISTDGNAQFDNASDFTNWLRGKTNVLLLTNRTDIDTFLPGFNTSASELPQCTVYKSQNGLQSVCVTDIFQTENCQNILKSAKQWWNDKQLYYINYGKNYDKFQSIVKFDNKDTICGLRQSGVKRGGKSHNSDDYKSHNSDDYKSHNSDDYKSHNSDDYKSHNSDDYKSHNSDDYETHNSDDYKSHNSDDSFEQTGGENTYTNAVCLATNYYKNILINPTQPENITQYKILDWYVWYTSSKEEIKFENKPINGDVLQQICKDAQIAMARYYQLTTVEMDVAIQPKFKIIFIEFGKDEDDEKTITVGIKTYIDNLLKVHETKLRETTDEDFDSNFIFIFKTTNTKFRISDKITSTNYNTYFTCYFGYLHLKRMEIKNDELIFVSPLPGSKSHGIKINDIQPVHGGSGKALTGKVVTGKAQQKPIAAAQKPGYPEKCNETLLFNKIEDFETLLECLTNTLSNRKDFTNIIGKQVIIGNDILSTNLLQSKEKQKFYKSLKTNIDKLNNKFNFIGSSDKNQDSITETITIGGTTIIINNKTLLNKLKNTTFNLMPINDLSTLMAEIIAEYYSKPPVTNPTPEPVDDLSTQMHIQITFTVCQIFPDKILEPALSFTNPKREGTIISTATNCFHKAYIKSILPIGDTSAQISKCNSVLINVENIYTSASALYALKNNGYRLVKLVDDREHAYFIENPKGFVKQPTRQSIKNVKNQVTQKVTEYKLGENVAVNSIPLEDIIELNPLIQKLTNEHADLDIAFLAKNPDATDLEHMAILRNGISYQTP